MKTCILIIDIYTKDIIAKITFIYVFILFLLIVVFNLYIHLLSFMVQVFL
jgi:hypothetical protein